MDSSSHVWAPPRRRIRPCGGAVTPFWMNIKNRRWGPSGLIIKPIWVGAPPIWVNNNDQIAAQSTEREAVYLGCILHSNLKQILAYKMKCQLAIKALMRNILIGALGLILFTDSDIE